MLVTDIQYKNYQDPIDVARIILTSKESFIKYFKSSINKKVILDEPSYFQEVLDCCLHHAAIGNSNNKNFFIASLIKFGADVNSPLFKGQNTLACLVTNKDCRNLSLFLGAGYKINSGDFLAIKTAVAHELVDELIVLLSYGADPNFLKGEGLTIAIQYQKNISMEILLDYGADPNIILSDGSSVLEKIVNISEIPGVPKHIFDCQVRLLLEHGLNPNIKGNNTNISNANLINNYFKDVFKEYEKTLLLKDIKVKMPNKPKANKI